MQKNEWMDEELLQRLQEQFASADHVYLMCFDGYGNRLTSFAGTAEEERYLADRIGEETVLETIGRLRHDTIETIVEQETGCVELKLCAVSVRLDGTLLAVWMAAGILADRLLDGETLPEEILTTEEARFYASVEFLSFLSAQLLLTQKKQSAAGEEDRHRQHAERAMKRQLERTQALTQILQMMEEDGSFEQLVEDILREACVSMGIAGGCLLRENEQGMADILCAYTEEPGQAFEQVQNISVKDLPFYNGKPYVVSADSRKPTAFSRLFTECGISAGIFEPVMVQGRMAMYYCMYDTSPSREWENADIKFISDVRRVIQSVLQRRITKNSLASSYTSLEAILENTGCGIYVADYKTRSILYMNHKFRELFARSIAGGNLDNLVFSEQETSRNQYFEETYSVVEERWLDVHKTEINWVDGRKVCMCTLYDITEKKRYQRQIEKQANNDFLTGLFNRMRCEQDLEHYIRKSCRKNVTGALLYLDLDDFKHINDGLGHQYGDILLKAISHSLRRIDGIENTCYRMGGDEFVVLVTDVVYPELDRVVRDIATIFSRPWFLKGEDYYCTMSMGIVRFPQDGDTVEELVKKADIALLSAKKRGKNRVEYYDEIDASSAYRRLDLEKNMRSAAMNACSEFEVFYQPIIDVQGDGEPCCGAEALVRWNSSALGFVNPEDFIPLAEYLGLINPIGEHVLRQAAARCKYWNDMGYPQYHVNVNLSVVQLLQNDIVRKVMQVLDETGIDPHNLTLEVTESLAINDMVRMKKVLSQIRELGVKVALDDFGTGYSSLNHIREMPLDVIKIDRCFIEHLGEDEFSDAFVRMVAELARTIGVRICVEGVETSRQRDIVKNMEISMIQGYFYGKPMRIAEFESKFLA